MITILFAYRNREIDRIGLAMETLKNQTDSSFKVIFADYGSDIEFSDPLKNLLEDYTFVEYFYLGHPGLLWNKSKAYNFGIKQANSDYILTADIDLLFHPETIENLNLLAKPDAYTLFKYGYLPESLNAEDIKNKSFEDLKPSHFGEVNGVGLYPKKALESVHGFDEFYHFYGLEDEDLFLRLEIAGYKRQREEKLLFLHQWHPRYPFKNDNTLTVFPRLRNAMRINQQHYFFCKKMGNSIPFDQKQWGSTYHKKDQEKLSKPDLKFKLDNSSASIIHFFNEFLSSCIGNVVSVEIEEKSNISKFKNIVKKASGGNTQPILTMKEVNDIILQRIIFNYRHHNYKYLISENHKAIYFTIDL